VTGAECLGATCASRSPTSPVQGAAGPGHAGSAGRREEIEGAALEGLVAQHLRAWDAGASHAELLARLRSLTNLRVVRDAASSTGWKVEIGPFPGWKDVPEW